VSALPYFQAAAAGVYLAAAIAIVAGRWAAPSFSNPWSVLATIGAFVADRALPGYGTVLAPLTFVFAAFCLVQIASARGGTRVALWRVLATLPIVVMLLVVAATSYSIADATVIRLAESGLLALPAPLALLAAMLPRAT